MGTLIATIVGSLMSSPRSLSAAGQDEHPWLVNNSTTARVSATAAAVTVPKQAEVSARTARRRAFMATPHPGRDRDAQECAFLFSRKLLKRGFTCHSLRGETGRGRSSRRELAQHVMQNASVTEIIQLIER